MSRMSGILGFKGEPGDSAYEVAVKNGFIGTEKDWLARLGTSSHFERDITTYVSETEGQTEFALPDSYTSDSFLDVYIEGERLGTDEYTLDIENKKIVLTNGLDVIGTKVEVVILTMSTNSLPIVEGLNQTVTNDTVLGAKGLFNLLPVNVKNFGATGNGVTDDTEAIQNAINYCFENKIGTLVIPNGNYLVSKTIEITQGDRYFNFEIKGYGYPHILPALEDFEGDYLIKVTANATNMNQFKRYFTIRDIVLGHDGDNTLAAITGMYIEQIQFLNLDNVMIRGFKKSGLILRDVFDSMTNNIRIINCGDLLNENSSNEDYALMLQGQIDNVNATHFYGLQIERCPLMLKIQSKIRHCQFTDCKFEQTAANYTNLSTIFVDGRSGENTFTNCQFVKNSIEGNNENQYFIETSTATSYSESAQFFVLFNGCMFTCSPTASNTGHWLNTDGATIMNCEFNHCGGNTNGLYTFRFTANNIFKNNRVYVTSWNTNTFTIKGEGNLIKDNVISYMAGDNINAGCFLAMDERYNNNVIEGNNIKGNPYSPYAIPNEYFGNTIIKNTVGREMTVISNAVGEPVLLYGSDILKIDYEGELPLYKFRFGHNGQNLKVWFKDNKKTIMHNPNYIHLKDGVPYTPHSNEVVEFVNIEGVWYQV